MSIVEWIIAGMCLLPVVVYLARGPFILVALLGIVAIILHGTYFFGPGIIVLLFTTYVVSTIAELVSLKTPIKCFGVGYRYANRASLFSSGIRLLGVYPLEVSLAWVILKYLSFCMALLISSAFSLSLLGNIILVPFILVSLDFILDPVSVHERKLWVWERGSRYFGIPFENFVGWYVVGLVATVLFTFLVPVAPVGFHPLFLIPVIIYGTFLLQVPKLFSIDRRAGSIGSIPALTWTVLGTVSLVVLYVRGS